MPTIQRIDAVAGAATLANALTGSPFEFLPYDATVEVACIQDAGTIGDLLVTVYAGSDLVTQDLRPLVKATAPVRPDDFTAPFDAYEGTRLTITARNTTAATTRNLLTTVIITPL